MRVTGDSTRQHDYNGGVEYDGRAMTDGGMITVTEAVRLRLVSGFSSRRTVTSSSSVSVSDPIVHYFFRSMQLEHTQTQAGAEVAQERTRVAPGQEDSHGGAEDSHGGLPGARTTAGVAVAELAARQEEACDHIPIPVPG